MGRWDRGTSDRRDLTRRGIGGWRPFAWVVSMVLSRGRFDARQPVELKRRLQVEGCCLSPTGPEMSGSLEPAEQNDESSAG